MRLSVLIFCSLIIAALMLWYIAGTKAETHKYACTVVETSFGYRKATQYEYFKCLGK